MIKINVNQQELEYKSLFFPFNAVKKVVPEFVTQDYLSRFCIHKTFNSSTGKIDRKYSWESILMDMNEHGILASVLDHIIQKEYLD
jgi:hypothetical protein